MKGTDLINQTICPFCKKENFCMANFPEKTCWCNDIKVPEELILLVPNKYKHKSCICKSCILEYKKDKKLFISNLK